HLTAPLSFRSAFSGPHGLSTFLICCRCLGLSQSPRRCWAAPQSRKPRHVSIYRVTSRCTMRFLCPLAVLAAVLLFTPPVHRQSDTGDSGGGTTRHITSTTHVGVTVTTQGPTRTSTLIVPADTPPTDSATDNTNTPTDSPTPAPSPTHTAQPAKDGS